MRILPLLVFAFVIVPSTGQQAKFVSKFTKIVTNYLEGNTAKACDLAATGLAELKPMDAIVTDIVKNILTLVPSKKYLPAMGMLTTFNSCINKVGGSMEAASEILGKAFTKYLTPPYNKCINKAKTMVKGKKPMANIKTEMYKLATAALTKDLIQKILNMAISLSTAPQWECTVPPLKIVLITSNYNIAFKKNTDKKKSKKG